jgi:hypothetical protein
MRPVHVVEVQPAGQRRRAPLNDREAWAWAHSRMTVWRNRSALPLVRGV